MLLLIAVFTLSIPSFLYAETFPVGCSVDDLISAVNQANANPGIHTLELSGGCIYTLTTVNNIDATGDNSLPKITTNITINGQAAIIERQADSPDFRFFHVETGASLQLNHLTLRNGRNSVAAKIDGGAIFNNGGSITITNSALTSNYAGCGGAIYNPIGTLTITGSTFSDNNGFS